MAQLNFSNSDFINARKHIKELLHAIENEDNREGPYEDARETNVTTKEQAMANLKHDMRKILQSPYTKPLPSVYGNLPLEAI